MNDNFNSEAERLSNSYIKMVKFIEYYIKKEEGVLEIIKRNANNGRTHANTRLIEFDIELAKYSIGLRPDKPEFPDFKHNI